MKIVTQLKYIIFLILFGTNSYAKIVKIKFEDNW